MRLNRYINEDESDKKARWANTFAKNHGGKTPDDKGWFDLCVTHMSDSMDEPEGFCAAVRDSWKGSTMWRKGRGDKTEKEAESDVKKNQNRPKGKREPAE